MNQNQLDERLQSYTEWRERLIQTITSFQGWLAQNELASSEQELKIFETINALKTDRLTLAFVAEFSRGKTELINALFFSQFGQRLLPSEAGRTTMCPTELFYDRQEEAAYIRLLPIETRTQDRSISDFKHEPIHWTQIPLDTNDPDQVAQALHEVIRTKHVSCEKALHLGLYDEGTDTYFRSHGKAPEQVEIPFWRHALISFPHELLKKGLVILDTPGLNALGNEPELTLSMLPAAQAILFLLAADTGVTRSDMEMWQHHVRTVKNDKSSNLIVVMNKIDTLWDDLKDNASVDRSIESQRVSCADLLHIKREMVFPLSAQKALIGRIRKDDRLLERSRLPELERHIAENVLPAKQEIMQNTIASQIGGLVDENILDLERKKSSLTKQLTELRSLRGKNADVIMHLMTKSREEQAAYLRNVESFQNSRRLLQSKARTMLETLSMDTLDRLINKTRESMTHSWTTAGMKRGMETFFDGARDTMEQVIGHSEQTRMLIRATYKKFHEEHGLPQTTPKQFSMSGFSAELERLYQEAEAFRRSPVTTMSEQSFVVKKFFISLVSHTRSLFFKANQDADLWLKEVMNPLIKQIKAHKASMEKRLDTLRRISESRDTLEARIKELDITMRETKQQLDALQLMHRSINTPLPGDPATGTDIATQKEAVV